MFLKVHGYLTRHNYYTIYCLTYAAVCMYMQHLRGLASWLPPEAGMFMWMRLKGGVKDADDIIDALKQEQVAVVPGMLLL